MKRLGKNLSALKKNKGKKFGLKLAIKYLVRITGNL